MVIFGASGDLTRRKLIPALYNLAKYDLLSREFAVIGVSRSPLSHEDFRSKVSEDIKQFATDKVDPDIWEWFVRRIYYLSGDMSDKNLYLQLKDLLDKVDRDHSTHGNHMYYLATAADYFGPAVEQLAEVGLMQQEGQRWRRVVIEKPFGHDLESARLLNQRLLRVAERKADLPHRPLPGEGNRPEHPGAALRQRNLRADLEPALHRPRTDFGSGNGGRGEARRLLRQGRRAAGHGAQPHHAAHQPDRDGAAGFISRRRRPRRTGKDPACHPAHEFGRRADPDGSRAVWRGHSAAENACLPIARNRACRPIPKPKPSLP